MIDYNIIQAINYFRAEAVNRSYVYKKSTGEFVFLPKKILQLISLFAVQQTIIE